MFKITIPFVGTVFLLHSIRVLFLGGAELRFVSCSDCNPLLIQVEVSGRRILEEELGKRILEEEACESRFFPTRLFVGTLFITHSCLAEP